MNKMFLNSFSFKGIFSLRDVKKTSVILYFLVLSLLMAFPLNLEYALHGTTDLNSVTNGFIMDDESWFPNELPSGYVDHISLVIYDDKVYVYDFLSSTGEPIKLVLNASKDYDVSPNSLVFYKDHVAFYNDELSCYYSDYSHITNQGIFFDQLKNEDVDESKKIFCSIFDEVFNASETIYLIVMNTFQTIIMNIVLCLIMSSIFLLIKVRYQKVTTFNQNINIIVSSLTIPTFIGFFGSLLSFSLGLSVELSSVIVVISSFITPLIALFAIYKGSPTKDILTKGL